MKAYDLPVSVPVLKMLKRDYGYSRHIRITNVSMWSRYNLTSSTKKIDEYLSTTSEGQVLITIVCPYASKRKLFNLCRALEGTFKHKMMIYVEGAAENGLDASEAIRKFMDRYDLSEEDMKWETAWKAWQRHKKKERERELIPLW